ncbi:MAG: hypothetical protein LBQ88_19215 [Treponema sp.]|jgi:hypothetical protein|nr:hypothetical protein [Treponema sp.]
MFRLFEGILRDFLGKYGRLFLDFCLENSFVVGVIVVSYGMILIIAQGNLDKIAKKARELGPEELFESKNPALILEKRERAFWDELRAVSSFPFIAHSTGLFLHSLSVKNMQKLLGRFIIYKQKNHLFKKK